MGRRPRGFWKDDANVEAALTALEDGSQAWPSINRFAAAGLKGLHHQLWSDGSADQWAERMGWRRPPRRGEPTRWPDARIEEALRAQIHRLGHWPSRTDLQEAGLSALAWTLDRRGDAHAWRTRLDAVSADPWRKWTDETIELNLHAAITKLGRWPSHSEFRRLGLDGLRKRLVHDGSTAEWARRFEVELPTKFVWLDGDIVAALEPLVSKLGRWPTRTELQGAGLLGLAASIERRGTAQAWAQHFEVPLTSSGRNERPADHLLEVIDAKALDGRTLRCSVEALLDPWVERLGRWPAHKDFVQAGRGRLYDRLGPDGRAFWRERLTDRVGDGSTRVRPPLCVAYDGGVAAAWRYARDVGHLDVPVGFRDPRAGFALRRWLELTEARSSDEARRASGLIADVRSICTDPYGMETTPVAHHFGRSMTLPFTPDEGEQRKW